MLIRVLIEVAGSIADPKDQFFACVLMNEWAAPEYPSMAPRAAAYLLEYYKTAAQAPVQWIEAKLAELCQTHGIKFGGANDVASAITPLSDIHSLSRN
jgi:hypothetical protein